MSYKHLWASQVLLHSRAMISHLMGQDLIAKWQ